MKGSNRANTFLIEIILVIFFFSISVSVALQFFVTAHKNQQLSEQKTAALMLNQTIVEKFNQQGEALFDQDGYRDAKNTTSDDEINLTLYYDSDCNIINGNYESATYSLEIHITKESAESGIMYSSSFQVFSNDNTSELLHELNSKKYKPLS